MRSSEAIREALFDLIQLFSISFFSSYRSTNDHHVKKKMDCSENYFSFTKERKGKDKKKVYPFFGPSLLSPEAQCQTRRDAEGLPLPTPRLCLPSPGFPALRATARLRLVALHSGRCGGFDGKAKSATKTAEQTVAAGIRRKRGTQVRKGDAGEGLCSRDLPGACEERLGRSRVPAAPRTDPLLPPRAALAPAPKRRAGRGKSCKRRLCLINHWGFSLVLYPPQYNYCSKFPVVPRC